MSAEIEREIAVMRAEWETHRGIVSADSAASAPSELGQQTADSRRDDIQVTDRMLAVERKYAPMYLNCRIRIRVLESRMADASGSALDALRGKLEQARRELAALDKARAEEIELARLGVDPVIGKDEGTPSSGRNVRTDSHDDGKAGGGID